MQGQEPGTVSPEANGGIAGDGDGARPQPPPPQPRPLSPPPTIKKLYLYSTPTHVLVFGRSKDRQRWRVLRIERDDSGGGGRGGGGGGRERATAATTPPPATPPASSSSSSTPGEDPSPSSSAFFEPDFLSGADADGRRPLRASADERVYDRASAAALLSSLSARARADGGELRLLTRADAVVGCLRFSAGWHYLVVVTRKRLEAVFGGGERGKIHKVYSVGATALVPLAEGGVEGAAEQKYRQLLAGVFQAGGFYFSHSWPLWLTTQRAEEAAEATVRRAASAVALAAAGRSDGDSSLPAGFCPFAELATGARVPWRHRCVWNGYATAALREAVAVSAKAAASEGGESSGETGGGGGGGGEASWALRPLVHGGWASGSLSLPGCPASGGVRVTLAARRSRHAAGTRYRRRGIDAAGRAANDVELEQIVEVVEVEAPSPPPLRWWWPLGPAAALVQVRGSAPVRWSQRPLAATEKTAPASSSFQPPEVVVRSAIRGGDPLAAASARHFADLERRYGSPVVVLDLLASSSLSSSSREAPLAAALKEAVETVNAVSGGTNPVFYESWDFKGAARREAAAFASSSGSGSSDSTQSQQQQRAFGTDLLRAAGARGAAATALTGLWVSSRSGGGGGGGSGIAGGGEDGKSQKQRGVLRTNCLDCLDRTHVAQAGVALFAFQACCAALGLVTSASAAAEAEAEEAEEEEEEEGSETGSLPASAPLSASSTAPVPPEIDLSSSAAAALAGIWTTVGNLLARQYGGSDAHQRALAERRGGGGSAAASAAANAASSSSSSSSSLFSVFSWMSRARAAASAAWNDVTRFYDSTYAGGARQIGLDLWLGKYSNSNSISNGIRTSASCSSSMAPSVNGPHPWERLGGGGGRKRRRRRGRGVVSTAGSAGGGDDGNGGEEEEDGDDDEGPGWDELAALRAESSDEGDGEEEEGAGRASRGPLSLFPLQQRQQRPRLATTTATTALPPPPPPPPPAAAFPAPPGSLLASFDRLRARNTGRLTAVQTVSLPAPSLPEWRAFYEGRTAAASAAAAIFSSPSSSSPSTPTRASPCPPSPPRPSPDRCDLGFRWREEPSSPTTRMTAAAGTTSLLEQQQQQQQRRWRLGGQGLSLPSLLLFQRQGGKRPDVEEGPAAAAAAAACAGGALAGTEEEEQEEKGEGVGKEAASFLAAASLFDADIFGSIGEVGGCRSLFDIGTFGEEEDEEEREDGEEETEEQDEPPPPSPLSPVSPPPAAAAPPLPRQQQQQQLLSPLRRRLSFSSGPALLSSAASASLDSWWGGGGGRVGEGFQTAATAVAPLPETERGNSLLLPPLTPLPRPRSSARVEVEEGDSSALIRGVPSRVESWWRGEREEGGERETRERGEEEERGKDGDGGGPSLPSFDLAGEAAEAELEDASRRVAAALASADAEQAERAAREAAARREL